jgi:hypothetical protein
MLLGGMQFREKAALSIPLTINGSPHIRPPLQEPLNENTSKRFLTAGAGLDVLKEIGVGKGSLYYAGVAWQSESFMSIYPFARAGIIPSINGKAYQAAQFFAEAGAAVRINYGFFDIKLESSAASISPDKNYSGIRLLGITPCLSVGRRFRAELRYGILIYDLSFKSHNRMGIGLSYALR